MGSLLSLDGNSLLPFSTHSSAPASSTTVPCLEAEDSGFAWHSAEDLYASSPPHMTLSPHGAGYFGGNGSSLRNTLPGRVDLLESQVQALTKEVQLLRELLSQQLQSPHPP